MIPDTYRGRVSSALGLFRSKDKKLRVYSKAGLCRSAETRQCEGQRSRPSGDKSMGMDSEASIAGSPLLPAGT